jgi:ABC-type multidrug transport system fused ATPase/permease subunit
VSALVAFLIAARAMHGPLNNTATQLLEIERNMASIERIRELLRTVPDLADRPDAVPFTGPVRSLRFENVTFRYPGTSDGVQGIDFEVRAGERLGVVGPSGSGKTTLVSLVARFYDPSAGRLVLNDRDLRDYRLADLYRHLAIVTQQPFVFETTVRENIRYGRPGASDEEVEEAARLAEIHDEIEALPQGYATELGAGGRGLSGGQMQRLNIARALLKNAPILILDEATSSIDSIAETRLQAAVARLLEGRTTFEIAHRLSTLRGVDRILVLDGGRLVGIGTHDELLVTCQLYRALSASQFRKESTVVPGPGLGVG